MDIIKTRNGLEKKFWEMCVPAVREAGYFLYDLEYLSSQKILRAYIMDEATSSAVIEDCIKVDTALTPLFEQAEWIPEDVVLEVSSPGVYRHVSSLAHFQMGMGEIHAVTIMGNLDPAANPGIATKYLGAKKFRGTLKKADAQVVVLETEIGTVNVPFNQIKNAGLDPDFAELMHKAQANEKNPGA